MRKYHPKKSSKVIYYMSRRFLVEIGAGITVSAKVPE